jgi:hypothetical protein
MQVHKTRFNWNALLELANRFGWVTIPKVKILTGYQMVFAKLLNRRQVELRNGVIKTIAEFQFLWKESLFHYKQAEDTKLECLEEYEEFARMSNLIGVWGIEGDFPLTDEIISIGKLLLEDKYSEDKIIPYIHINITFNSKDLWRIKVITGYKIKNIFYATSTCVRYNRLQAKEFLKIMGINTQIGWTYEWIKEKLEIFEKECIRIER